MAVTFGPLARQAILTHTIINGENLFVEKDSKWYMRFDRIRFEIKNGTVKATYGLNDADVYTTVSNVNWSDDQSGNTFMLDYVIDGFNGEMEVALDR